MMIPKTAEPVESVVMIVRLGMRVLKEFGFSKQNT